MLHRTAYVIVYLFMLSEGCPAPALAMTQARNAYTRACIYVLSQASPPTALAVTAVSNACSQCYSALPASPCACVRCHTAAPPPLWLLHNGCHTAAAVIELQLSVRSTRVNGHVEHHVAHDNGRLRPLLRGVRRHSHRCQLGSTHLAGVPAAAACSLSRSGGSASYKRQLSCHHMVLALRLHGEHTDRLSEVSMSLWIRLCNHMYIHTYIPKESQQAKPHGGTLE